MNASEVEIVEFPETRVAALRHFGPRYRLHETLQRFIEWRIENSIGPKQGRTFALHYTDPQKKNDPNFCMYISVSVPEPVKENHWGVRTMTLPAGLCAKISHKGQRDDIPEATYLAKDWLPDSGYLLRTNCPFIFHYLNIGPLEAGQPLLTDLYLPIRKPD